MTQEKAAVAQAEAQVEAIQDQITEAKEQGAPPQEIRELQAQLDKASKEIEKWQSEAKGQQRAARKASQQLEDWTSFKTGIESQISIIGEGLADLMDRIGKTDDEPDEVPRRKSNEYRERFKSAQQSTQTAAQEAIRQKVLSVANEIDSVVRPTGMDMARSPELRTAFALFRAGDYEEALDEAKKAVSNLTEAKKQTAKTETPEEMEKRLREEITKKIYQEKGFNISDTGGGNTGGGKGLTIEAIRKMSPQELVANAKEIAKMKLSL